MAARTYDYVVVLKQRDFKLVDNISLLMLFLAIVVLMESALTPFSYNAVFPITIVALIIGWVAYTFVRKRNGKTAYFRIAMLFAAWGLMMTFTMPFTWIAAVYVIAAVAEKQVKFPREVAFDEEEVVFNTFPRSHYHWSEFSNVLLKDGLLTIDFKNNKLLQKEIDSHVSPQLEKDFNDFCKERINEKSE